MTLKTKIFNIFIALIAISICLRLIKYSYPKNLSGEEDYEKKSKYGTKFGGQNKNYLLWAAGNENDWWWRNRVEKLVNPKPSLTSGSHFLDAHIKAKAANNEKTWATALKTIKSTCESRYKEDEETDLAKLREIWRYCSIDEKNPNVIPV